jgi:hypothetical protein
LPIICDRTGSKQKKKRQTAFARMFMGSQSFILKLADPKKYIFLPFTKFQTLPPYAKVAQAHDEVETPLTYVGHYAGLVVVACLHTQQVVRQAGNGAAASLQLL